MEQKHSAPMQPSPPPGAKLRLGATLSSRDGSPATPRPSSRKQQSQRRSPVALEMPSIDMMPNLRVKFPDPSDNAMRRRVETILSELKDFGSQKASDNDKVRNHVQLLTTLTRNLEDQMSLPVEVQRNVSLNVAVAQREAKRVAVEEEEIKKMANLFPTGSPKAVAPDGNVVVDEHSDKKIRLLLEMLQNSSNEVTKLRESIVQIHHTLSQKDNKILELEASMHSSALTMAAMELAMTKLKRKAAVGGGGGGGNRSNSAGKAELFGETSINSDGVIDRVAIARQAINNDRRKSYNETPHMIQVDAPTHDFGPKGRIALVAICVPNLGALARQYPEAMAPAMDALRDSVRGVLEVCDGFEFRQKEDMFACAFDDCTGALDFSIQLQLHLHNNTTWPKEIDQVDEFKSVLQENGLTLFHGLRVAIGVHYGVWNGTADLLTQKKLYTGEMFDKVVQISKSTPAGIVYASNEVLQATGVREFLVEKVVAVAAVPGWGVAALAPFSLKDRLNVATAIPDAPLLKIMMEGTAATPVQPPLEMQCTVVCIQIEGFFNTLIEADVPPKELYQAVAMLKKHMLHQMKWSSRRSLLPPITCREEGGDKYMVLFESAIDALDFVVALQHDAMLLHWPDALLNAALGIEEKLKDAGNLITFRGFRLQVGVHSCKCQDVRITDLFTNIPKWIVTDANVPIGFSWVARGGETIVSQSTRDAVIEEQKKFKDDVRLADAVWKKMSKRIAVPGFSEGLDAFYFASQGLMCRFPDAFPPSETNGAVVKLSQFGVFRAPIGKLNALVCVTISHWPILTTVDPDQFRKCFAAYRRLLSLAVRRFAGAECVAGEDSPNNTIVCVFESVKVAVECTLFLQEELLTISLDENMTNTNFSQYKTATDNSVLFNGLRLKASVHLGMVEYAKLPPATGRPVVLGSGVLEALAMLARCVAGNTLLSPNAMHELFPLQHMLHPKAHFHELLDLQLEDFPHKGNFVVVLPLTLKERVMQPPPATSDDADGYIANTIKLTNSKMSGLQASASMRGRPQTVQAPPQRPLFDPDACMVTGDEQMFVVCRVPGITAFSERAPQFAKDALKLFLTCARELITPLGGKEVECDGDALLLTFPTAVAAVQWAQQLQVSLVCAKWAVEIISTDFCKEVKSTTKGSGAGRGGALFRGLRALVAMDYGSPKRKFLAEKLTWHFYGDVVKNPIYLSHWGHGGMIILSKRAKAVIAQELTNEATRAVLESPNISTIGTRLVDPNGKPEELYSLIPLAFFERAYPQFSEAASEEKRLTAVLERTIAAESIAEERTSHVFVVFPPNTEVPQLGSTPSDDHALAASSMNGGKKVAAPLVESESDEDLDEEALSTTNSKLLASKLGRSHSVLSSSSNNSEKPKDSTPIVLTSFGTPPLQDAHILAMEALLENFDGMPTKRVANALCIAFPSVAESIAFSLALQSTGGAWTAKLAFSIDDSVDVLGLYVAPLLKGFGEILVTEDAMRALLEPQGTIMRGATLGGYVTLDAVPVEDIETPAIRVLRVCAAKHSHNVDLSASERKLPPPFRVPDELWKRPEVAPDASGVRGSGDGSAADAPIEPAVVVDIFAPFEKEERDSDFMRAIESLTSATNPDSGALTADDDAVKKLSDLWEATRQEAAQDSRRVKLLEQQVAELNDKIVKIEVNNKQGAEGLLRAHKCMRYFRSKLEVYFKKGMVEEVVYGSDADNFVSDWLAAIKPLVGQTTTKRRANEIFSPREEFSSMLRHAIEDDGSEGRANSNRLYQSMVGHFAKIFSGVEKLLKQRERIHRVGTALNQRTRSQRFSQVASAVAASAPNSAPTLAQSVISKSIDDIKDIVNTKREAGSPPQQILSDDRKRSLRSKLKSVMLVSGI